MTNRLIHFKLEALTEIIFNYKKLDENIDKVKQIIKEQPGLSHVQLRRAVMDDYSSSSFNLLIKDL